LTTTLLTYRKPAPLPFRFLLKQFKANAEICIKTMKGKTTDHLVLLLSVLLEGPARGLEYLDVERIAHDFPVDLAELVTHGHAHQQPALLVEISHPMHGFAEVRLVAG